MKVTLLAPLALLALIGASCGSQGPVDIDTSSDACSRCRMSIDQIVHAGEIITASGDVKKYDSLGCLIADYREARERGGEESRIFVIDYRTHKWIDARSAHYAMANLPTDHMGFGAAALADNEQALALVGGAADKVVTWKQLVSRKAQEPTR